MKWLLGAALALALLAALAVGAAAWLLPGMVASDATRARIESAAEAALGRALRYEKLELGLLPPSLRVIAPSIAGAAPEAPPFAEARQVSLRVALLPLLARQLQIDGVLVDGATLRLRRSAAGLDLPRPASKPPKAARSEPKASEGGPPQESPPKAARSEPKASEGGPPQEGPPPLAVRKLDLRDATLIFEDAAAQPSVTRELRDLQGEIEMEGPGSGRFEIDATQSDLVYSRAFHKPAGTPATLSGRLVSRPDGALGFDDLELRLRDLDASAELRSGERMGMELRASPFDLAGWEALVPALAGWKLAGRLAPGALRLEQAPTELHGRIDLGGVRAVSPHGGELVLRGALLGEGTRVHSDGLELLAADQKIRADAELAELGTPAARWRLRFDARDADLGRLTSGFADPRRELRGRLTTEGDLSLPLGSAGNPLTSLRGRVRVAIREGWTSGRSLLASTLDALIAVAQPLDLLSRGLKIGSGKGSADHFESVTGSFEIGRGLARTEDLRIIGREHSIDLSGTLRLTDLALDMRGTLTFADARDDEPGGLRPGIPIAHIGGTLGDPRVEVSRDAARIFAALLEPSRLGAKLERAIGPDGARDLADGFGRLLDKAARKRR